MGEDGMLYFSDDENYPGKHDELPGGGPTDEDLEKFISPNEMKKMREIESRVLRDFGGSDTPGHINRGQFGFRFKDWSNNTDHIKDEDEEE